MRRTCYDFYSTHSSYGWNIKKPKNNSLSLSVCLFLSVSVCFCLFLSVSVFSVFVPWIDFWFDRCRCFVVMTMEIGSSVSIFRGRRWTGSSVPPLPFPVLPFPLSVIPMLPVLGGNLTQCPQPPLLRIPEHLHKHLKRVPRIPQHVRKYPRILKNPQES